MKKILAFGVSLFLTIAVNLLPVQAVGYQSSNIYVVQSGDALPAIAHTYGTTVEELMAANGLHSELVTVGQKLFVPMIYVVKSGDHLKKIAAASNSTAQLIKTTNGLASDQLYMGQMLMIPPKRLNMHGQYILMTRVEFANWLFHNQFTRKITLIQQHHTWLPSYKHFHGSNHVQMLKGMENFHVKENGWKNIAQNITTFPDGTVAVSRPFNSAPEGSIGAKANAAGISIEHVGNFDIGHDVMTKEQSETIIFITAALSIKFGLTPSIDSITYHHWWDLGTGERVLDNAPAYNVKTCPGTGFFGGNTTTDAKTHFFPLVEQKMREISAALNKHSAQQQ